MLGIIEVQGARLDLAYLRTMAMERALADLLDRCLAESELEGEV